MSVLTLYVDNMLLEGYLEGTCTRICIKRIKQKQLDKN